VHFLGFPDKKINELGAREIGKARIAAGITNAVHRAAGVRERELPVKIENSLA
jgi:xanthine dehydrogenase YagR molybdenum-binding subunit